MHYFFIILGGGIGALLRYLSTQSIGTLVKMSFPAGTLVANAAGAFIIGFLFGLFESRAVPQGVRLLLITGFLGGFTTFSSYSLETARLFAEGRFAPALINIGLHNVLCLGLALLGLGISQGLRS
jgi:CrcB protein